MVPSRTIFCSRININNTRNSKISCVKILKNKYYLNYNMQKKPHWTTQYYWRTYFTKFVLIELPTET